MIASVSGLAPLAAAGAAPDLTRHPAGYAVLVVFALAYVLVMLEERIHLRKSKPVMVAAGLIWALVGLAYARAGDTTTAAEAVRHGLAEYGELFLFILAAMTFVNTLEERRLFDWLRALLVRRRLSLRAVFWVTGALAFGLSSLFDNLTTALVMGTVVATVGRGYPKFVALACVNVVVAANAGGAFSPFGDITTLMVWQAGRAEFFDFFRLFVPSLVSWTVPALLMSLAVGDARPAAVEEWVQIRRGGWVVAGLFLATVATAVVFHAVLALPPVLGMTTGLGALQLYSWHLRRTRPSPPPPAPRAAPGDEPPFEPSGFAAPDEPAFAIGSGWRPGAEEGGVALLAPPRRRVDVDDEGPLLGGVEEPAEDGFDIFEILRRAEWDTLMFFYGIILCVGGLATAGYLAGLSELLYAGLGVVPANVAVGVVSAVVDNIPVMFAVLQMGPAMDLSGWLLVTLTAGVGGSLLSVGSAAGVALMGQARGSYTFLGHLRWSWAIALGYGLAIWTHLLING